MRITPDLILNLERLSRLALSDTDRIQAAGDLQKMVALVDSLQQLDLTDIEPLTHISDDMLDPRPDTPGQPPTDLLNRIAPPVLIDNFLGVPKVPGKE